jgi:hypothetical protein
MESEYVVPEPAATVAVEDAAARPKVEPMEPVRETVCGLFGALLEMVIVPVRVPLALGVKVTLRVQV